MDLETWNAMKPGDRVRPALAPNHPGLTVHAKCTTVLETASGARTGVSFELSNGAHLTYPEDWELIPPDAPDYVPNGYGVAYTYADRGRTAQWLRY